MDPEAVWRRIIMLNWLTENYVDVINAACQVVTAASVIVLAIAKFTKTKKDDKIGAALARVEPFLSKLALNPKKK
jgi:hypothetical protein